MDYFKAFGKVLWLALRPFDTLQNVVGAFGVLVNLALSLGIIGGGGAIGWLYFPQNNGASAHNWLPAVIIGVSALALFVLIAAIKLQLDKDRLNGIRFMVESKVLNQGAILEVTNEAQIATFRATARIHNDVHHKSELFPLYWEGYGENVSLGNGDTRSITVARQNVVSSNPFVIGLSMIKSTPSGPGSFYSCLGDAGGEYKWNPGIVYIEVTIKPLSSSKREHKAYYALEQPSITELKFYKVDSLPSTPDKEDSQT